MNKSFIAFAALALSASQAHAKVIASEFFKDPSYSQGSNLYPNSNQDIGYGLGIGPNDGTGFTTGWQNPYYTATRTVGPALSYPGLATSGNGGASPTFDPTQDACVYCVNSTAIRTFSDNTATTNLWVSFLIEDNGVSPQNLATYPNYAGFGITDASGTPLFAGVPGVQPVATADYSLQSPTLVVQSAMAAAPGQTDLIVVDVRNNGEAYLYVDPTMGQPLGAPDATIATTLTPAGATGLYWTDSWGWTYGDVRVGTTLGDVTPVPEPATWTILLVGFAGLGVALRARRANLRAAVVIGSDPDLATMGAGAI